VDNETVGLRELGQNVSRVLARVKKGESLVVTEHGKPVARLVPFTQKSRLQEMIDSGEAIPAEISTEEFFKNHTLLESDVRLSDVLREMRDDERW
jgi:prevent-host-death family protein